MKCSQCKGCVQSQCHSGFYGPTCNLPCFPNCRAVPCANCTCEVCDSTSGYCTNGCDYGFYGTKCESVCPENCRYLERKTVNCDKYSGFCLNGCKPGFYGDWCNNTCNEGCKESLCKMPNGTCVKGCIQGYSGDICDSPASRSWDHSEIAGAIGGGFVVVLWATVVVVLIFVIWRRRLKDYAVFKINTPLGAGPHRGSSRRRLRRHDSDSSSHQEHLLYDAQNPDSAHKNNHLPLDGARSLNLETEPLMYCKCSRTKSCDFLYSPENAECVVFEPNHRSENFHVHFLNEGTSIQNKRASSEGDLSEMSAVWKPRKY